MGKIAIIKKSDFISFCFHLQKTFFLFRKNDPLRLAGATAFFANFAIPPILLILIRLFGFFIDRKILVTRIFERISQILIPSSTNQIRETLRNIRGVDHNLWATILSFVFFIFVATTLFNVIKNSVEQIWNIGMDEKASFLFTLKIRGRSMIIILLAGILFFVGLVTDSLQAFVSTYLSNTSPNFGKWILWALNQTLFTLIVTTWFTVLFRFLTNARPSWKISIQGGLLTGILFTLGKYVLRIMLPLSNIENIYGASGSIVLVMLFVFYSSLIFYFGACFIKVRSENRHKDIKPIKGAFTYELKEII
ncbi:YihY/virulence factor BrkB family protein [Pedobacter sp. ASV28]|uniref:YihY/virulence factor BrkB family protein n=1 Tax=Pedobacter sp. ASV28 TaxID=2795123 RepID=UPI0018EB2206|nr:YihY/virulence factor BrkB family protein [Pedobacter sp. ASV28]